MKLEFSFICICAFLLFSSAKSCTKDTCNIEDTFSQITLTKAPVKSVGDTVKIFLEFVLKTALPDGYFKAVVVDQGREDRFGNPWDNDFKHLFGVEMSASGATLNIKRDSIKEGSNQGSFHFKLPDRRSFIDCGHPGGADSYLLDLGFTILNTVNAYSAKDLNWKEELRKGPF